MTMCDYGKQQIAIRIGSNISVPAAVAIGTGSGTELASRIALISESTRAAFSDTDFDSTPRKISFTSDFTSVAMSGIQLREFGVFNTSAANTGSLWQLEAFNAITFDGTMELQVESNWEIY